MRREKLEKLEDWGGEYYPIFVCCMEWMGSSIEVSLRAEALLLL